MAVRARPAFALRSGLYYTSIEDLHLFYEVGDAPYGLYWPSIVPPTV